MATRGTRWVADRCTDLLPGLLGLALQECRHGLAGSGRLLDAAADQATRTALAALDGADRADGAKGSEGADGAKGVKGAKGAKGANGPYGPDRADDPARPGGSGDARPGKTAATVKGAATMTG